MNKVLVTYATMAGSTAEVARTIGEEITSKSLQAELKPLESITDLASYSAVVLGAPMIMGWHRSALGFLRKNRKELEHIPLAIFAMGMSLTSAGETDLDGVPVCLDENLAKPPQNINRPSFREHHTSLIHYAAPILKAAAPARPVSMAFFGGKLDYYRLKFPAKLFVMLVVQAQPGDRRDWRVIRAWAASLPHLFDPGRVGE
jgi:menaquinone-dependent protoporphyrinogen oxidase